MGNKNVLEVEIVKKGSFGEISTCTLELPATMWELNDALERARIKDENTPYSVEVLGTHHEYLSEIIV